MPVVEKIHRQNGLVYVSLEGLLGGCRVEKFFVLPLNLEHRAQFLLDWMFRESLYGGLAKVVKASPQFVERALAKGTDGKVCVKIISCGTTISDKLSRWSKAKWRMGWLVYKVRTALSNKQLK
jgi:hypothetical protein